MPGHQPATPGLGADGHESLALEIGQTGDVGSVGAGEDHRAEVGASIAAGGVDQGGGADRAVARFQLYIVGAVGDHEVQSLVHHRLAHLLQAQGQDDETVLGQAFGQVVGGGLPLG